MIFLVTKSKQSQRASKEKQLKQLSSIIKSEVEDSGLSRLHFNKDQVNSALKHHFNFDVLKM